MADALLPCWTPMCLARREAHGLWDGVRAEEALGTCRGVLVARPCTPSPLAAAHQPRGTSRFLVGGNPEAPLALLALAKRDAKSHQRSVARCREVTAGLSPGALLIRHALAVSAVLRPEPRVRQTAERKFAVRAQPAVAAVCAQPGAALRVEQGADGPAARTHLRYRRRQQDTEQRREREGEEQGRKNSQHHTPVHPPHFSRHSSVYRLSPPQNWSYPSGAGGLHRP
jgi:hypothetical protein